MKRLTRRFCGGIGVVEGYELDKISGAKAIVNRLAAYEDSGLEPEELKRIGCLFSDDSCTGMNFVSACIDAAKAGISTNRIRELAEAEQDGRLVVLPCKVGDTVFKPVVTGEGLKFVWPIYINNFTLEIGEFNLESYAIGETENGSGITIGIDDFCKTVFMTRDEAEAALEKEGGKDNA